VKIVARCANRPYFPQRVQPARFGIWFLGFGICLALLLLTSAALAQHHESTLPSDFDQPIRLYSVGLGKFTRAISSKNAEAQA